MMAGNAIPKADKHSAPNNEMKRASLGIATASRTKQNKKKITCL